MAFLEAIPECYRRALNQPCFFMRALEIIDHGIQDLNLI